VTASIILAHPRRGSFSHAIAEAAEQALRAGGTAVLCHDLYAEKFDPVMGADEAASRVSADPLIERHCAEIATARIIVLVHPNWWSGPPAILKGWADRVLRPGVAYGFASGDAGKGAPVGLLKAHKVLVFASANMPREAEQALLGNPLETLWKKSVFAQCGVGDCELRIFSPLAAVDAVQRELWLQEAARLCAQAAAKA